VRFVNPVTVPVTAVSPVPTAIVELETVTEISVHEYKEPSSAFAASVDIHHEIVVEAPLSLAKPLSVAVVVEYGLASTVLAVGGPAFIVTLKVAVTVSPFESVTCTNIELEVPVVVGIPVTFPETEPSDKPVGQAPETFSHFV
jgi:hypothetical protein